MKKLKKDKYYARKNVIYLLFMLPAFVCLILFWAVPLYGNILAFKDYSYIKGIWGSKWVGFDNFKQLMQYDKFWAIARNTILYHIAEVVLVNLFGGAVFALILYEVHNRHLNKIYQTSMLLPNFLSMTVVAYVVYLILNPTDVGVLTNVLKAMGIENVDVYSMPVLWPFILLFVHGWKLVGMAALYLYAALLAVDTELFEAAALDGAGRLKQIWYISVPAMLPMMCMTMITQLGNILASSFDLHYQVTKQMGGGVLSPTTNVLSIYSLQMLQDGNMGLTTALGMATSAVTIILTIIVNRVVKKLSPENAIF